MKIHHVKPVNKGYIVSRFSVELDKIGLTIHECTLFKKGDRMWVSMPQRMYEKDGEKKYFPYIQWEKDKKEIIEREIIAELAKIDATSSMLPANDMNTNDLPF